MSAVSVRGSAMGVTPTTVSCSADPTLRDVESIRMERDDQPLTLGDAPWYRPRNSDDLHRTYRKVVGSMCGMMIRLCLLVVPGFMIYLGATNLENCPVKRLIPIWGIVMDSLWTIHTMLYFMFRNSPERGTVACRFLEGIFFYAVFVWVICGLVWIVGTVARVDLRVSNPRSDNFCHPWTYLVNMVVLATIQLVSLAAVFIFRFTYNQDSYE